jgi:hypothetical protein
VEVIVSIAKELLGGAQKCLLPASEASQIKLHLYSYSPTPIFLRQAIQLLFTFLRGLAFTKVRKKIKKIPQKNNLKKTFT